MILNYINYQYLYFLGLPFYFKLNFLSLIILFLYLIIYVFNFKKKKGPLLLIIDSILINSSFKIFDLFWVLKYLSFISYMLYYFYFYYFFLLSFLTFFFIIYKFILLYYKKINIIDFKDLLNNNFIISLFLFEFNIYPFSKFINISYSLLVFFLDLLQILIEIPLYIGFNFSYCLLKIFFDGNNKKTIFLLLKKLIFFIVFNIFWGLPYIFLKWIFILIKRFFGKTSYFTPLLIFSNIIEADYTFLRKHVRLFKIYVVVEDNSIKFNPTEAQLRALLLKILNSNIRLIKSMSSIQPHYAIRLSLPMLNNKEFIIELTSHSFEQYSAFIEKNNLSLNIPDSMFWQMIDSDLQMFLSKKTQHGAFLGLTESSLLSEQNIGQNIEIGSRSCTLLRPRLNQEIMAQEYFSDDLSRFKNLLLTILPAIKPQGVFYNKVLMDHNHSDGEVFIPKLIYWIDSIQNNQQIILNDSEVQIFKEYFPDIEAQYSDALNIYYVK